VSDSDHLRGQYAHNFDPRYVSRAELELLGTLSEISGMVASVAATSIRDGYCVVRSNGDRNKDIIHELLGSLLACMKDMEAESMLNIPEVRARAREALGGPL
jgi:hypothetical protein